MAQKLDKVSLIRQLFNGAADLSALRPSQSFIVDYDSLAGLYFVDGKKMNLEQYEQWKEKHFRPDADILFLTTLDRSKEPESEPEPVKVKEAVKVKEVSQPLMAIKKLFQPTKKEVKESIIETKSEEPQQPKRAGMLSEYGLTWECDPSNRTRDLFREPQVYNQKFTRI